MKSGSSTHIEDLEVLFLFLKDAEELCLCWFVFVYQISGFLRGSLTFSRVSDEDFSRCWHILQVGLQNATILDGCWDISKRFFGFLWWTADDWIWLTSFGILLSDSVPFYKRKKILMASSKNLSNRFEIVRLSKSRFDWLKLLHRLRRFVLVLPSQIEATVSMTQ